MVTKLKLLIVGGGDTAEILLSDPAFREITEEVVVIEKDSRRRSVFEKLGDVFFIEGDVINLPLHEYVNLREINAVFALTGRDEINFLVLAMASIYEVPIRIGIFRSKHVADIVKRLRLGIPLIKPSFLAGSLKQTITSMVSVREIHEVPAGKIYVVSISETDIAAYSKLGELKLEEDGAYVLAIFSGDNILPPSSDIILEPGYTLLVLAPNIEFAKKIRG
ncbi:MAG: NAD-binding protein [Desulfurococcaceae archaeon]|jgi:trk system potassium uptake protein TrkA|nr:NAD-binding protein [Desulfurococcaceae archaeon]